jgi:hypothetical protein
MEIGVRGGKWTGDRCLRKEEEVWRNFGGRALGQPLFSALEFALLLMAKQG